MKSVGSSYLFESCCDADFFLALSSRMSRQKEIVSRILVLRFRIKDKSSVETLITLLKAQKVHVASLDIEGDIGEEEWQALNRALQGKEHVFVGEVLISRKDLKDVRDISIKGIWDATMRGFRVHNMESKLICKHDHDWEDAWARLKKISDMSEDEFTAECRLRKAF